MHLTFEVISEFASGRVRGYGLPIFREMPAAINCSSVIWAIAGNVIAPIASNF